MPIDKYDHLFGSRDGSANKALAGLVKQYGLKEGHRIFYALAEKRRKARKSYGRAKHK